MMWRAMFARPDCEGIIPTSPAALESALEMGMDW